METICAYCRDTIIESEEAVDAGPSHGMCKACREHFIPQWEGLTFGEYLDRFEMPVLIVDENVSILAANQQMADLIGRPERELQGLLGGDVLECAYSRLEGGCGQTVHCTTCTVRNSINHTFKTGETLDKVLCYVDQDSGRQYFLVTTVKILNSIQVAVEPAPEE